MVFQSDCMLQKIEEKLLMLEISYLNLIKLINGSRNIINKRRLYDKEKSCISFPFEVKWNLSNKEKTSSDLS